MDKVAQLVKLAKKKDNNAGKKAAAAGIGAAYLGSKVPSRLLGYHNVYHGNSSSSVVRKIKANGLKTSFGGTGVSQMDDHMHNAGTSNNVARSKGKVHFSKSKITANHYTKDMFTPLGDYTKVVKGRMPHNQYTKSKEDPLVRTISDKARGKAAKKDAYKHHAATSTHGLPPSRIAGGVGDKGIKQFATKKNMSRYLKSSSGKIRFARGIASAAGAGVAATYAAKKLYEKAKSSKS